MKLRSLAAVSAVLASGLVLPQLVMAQAKPATPAARPAAPAAAPAASTASNRTTLGYALGYRLARGLAESKVDVDINAMIRAIQEGYAKKEPTMPRDQLGQALEQFTRKMADQEKAEFDRVSRENKTKSDQFLAANKAKPGVVTLPSGVQYRIIEPGTGAKPTAASTMQMTLRASLTSGQALGDTNGETSTVKMTDLGPEMAGVKEALMMMPAGSRWEIYVPSNKAYGDNPRSPVGPNQALVFEIRLVSVN